MRQMIQITDDNKYKSTAEMITDVEIAAGRIFSTLRVL